MKFFIPVIMCYFSDSGAVLAESQAGLVLHINSLSDEIFILKRVLLTWPLYTFTLLSAYEFCFMIIFLCLFLISYVRFPLDFRYAYLG